MWLSIVTLSQTILGQFYRFFSVFVCVFSISLRCLIVIFVAGLPGRRASMLKQRHQCLIKEQMHIQICAFRNANVIAHSNSGFEAHTNTHRNATFDYSFCVVQLHGVERNAREVNTVTWFIFCYF